MLRSGAFSAIVWDERGGTASRYCFVSGASEFEPCLILDDGLEQAQHSIALHLEAATGDSFAVALARPAETSVELSSPLDDQGLARPSATFNLQGWIIEMYQPARPGPAVVWCVRGNGPSVVVQAGGPAASQDDPRASSCE